MSRDIERPLLAYGALSRKPLSSLSCCFSCVQLFAILWTAAHQAPLSMGFSRQEYWSGLPCPPSGDLPDPGIESMSLVSPACSLTGQGTKILTIPPTLKQTSQMPEREVDFSQRNTKKGLANEGDKTQGTKHRLSVKGIMPRGHSRCLGSLNTFLRKATLFIFKKMKS